MAEPDSWNTQEGQHYIVLRSEAAKWSQGTDEPLVADYVVEECKDWPAARVQNAIHAAKHAVLCRQANVSKARLAKWLCWLVGAIVAACPSQLTDSESLWKATILATLCSAAVSKILTDWIKGRFEEPEAARRAKWEEAQVALFTERRRKSLHPED